MATSASSSWQALQDRWSTGFSTPMQSKDDVLLEEIHYLRQMLADANEEKGIQVAIVRDEVSEKQRLIDELTRRHADAEASLRTAWQELEQLRAERAEWRDARGSSGSSVPSRAVAATAPSELPVAAAGSTVSIAAAAAGTTAAEQQLGALRQLLEQQHSELERRGEELRAQRERERGLRADCQEAVERQRTLQEACTARSRELERSSEALGARVAAREAELRELRARLARREAPMEAVAACGTEAELEAWEREVLEATRLALGRLRDRRVELRVASIMEAHDTAALCKICYDCPASCALLPCRHHAFCKPCARRVENSHDPVCPLCRSLVTGRFETFAS